MSAMDENPTPAPDPVRDAEELADFVDYLATEIFDSLPGELQVLSPSNRGQPLLAKSPAHNPGKPSRPTTSSRPMPSQDPPLPRSTEAFLLPILTAYLAPLITPPPATAATRADACEICGRDWIPLSYHHLIPRFVHEKAVKRGWHQREDLQNVAWLCGACHRFVHHCKDHEELARNYYTVELLLEEEEEVRRFAAWVRKLRWKGGRTRRAR